MTGYFYFFKFVFIKAHCIMRRLANFSGMQKRLLLAAILTGFIFSGSSFAQADFLSFNFTLSPSFTETINTTTRVIDVEVYNTADVANLTAVFTTSPNAVVRIGSMTQVSGQSINNFTGQVTYLITSADGTITREWYVNVTRREVSTDKQLLGFQFASIGADATINEEDHTVYITVPNSQDVTSLVATFQVSPLATLLMNGEAQVSGVSANDYTNALEENGNTITLIVVAENGSSRNYYISVRRSAALSGKEISYFAFESLDPNVVGAIDQTNSTIALTVPYETDLTTLATTFTNSYLSTVRVGTVIQISGVTPNDFTNPVSYTVVAENGTSKVYEVTVTKSAASIEKQITAFKFSSLSPEVVATVTEADHTIVATIPYAADVTNLIVTFTASAFTRVTVNGELQVSGITPNNFTSSVIYTVTAQDQTTQNYTVTVSQQAASQDNDFLTFVFEAANNAALSTDATGAIDTEAKTVVAQVPYNTDVTALIATFTKSPLSTVKIGSIPQISGISTNNFTTSLHYVITAEDGSSEIYVVTVNQTAASQENSLISFKFEAINNASLIIDHSAAIDHSSKTAIVHVPYGTDLTGLIATFIVSNYAHAKVGSVSQVSGVTQNDFSGSLQYAVIAQDGSTELYTLTVVVDANTAKQILAYTFKGITPAAVGVINETTNTITVNVPNSTNLTALVASFSLSEKAEAFIGAVKQISGSSANDFSSPVSYSVVADDGSTQIYVVVVNVLPVQTGKAITDFRFDAYSPVVVGTIDQTAYTITAQVPVGTDLTTLIPNFTHSLLSTISVGGVGQVSGSSVVDFTSPVTYRVTAEDGGTQDYVVTVTEKPASTENDLLYFAFESFTPNVVGTINQSTYSVTLVVPYGTVVTQLVASFTISEYADVKIMNGGYQQSGITQNDYTYPVVYEVYAQNGSSQSYVITVTETPDITAPVVSADAQSVSNVNGNYVLVSSNEGIGKVYIIHEDAPQATIAEFNAAISLGMGRSAYVQQANHNNPISAHMLVEGTYYAYAIDASANISQKGTNPIVIVDELAPEIRINTQIVSNSPNTYILAQSSEDNSFIYLIKEGVPQTTQAEMELAISSRNGTKVFAPVADVNGSLLVSGLNPGSYRAYAIDQNGNISAPSTNAVVIKEASREKSVLNYSISSTNPFSIGTVSGTDIAVEVPNGSDLTALVASFTLSANATAFIGLIEQVSGISSNDFSIPVIYTVEAEDGSTANYTVTVTEASGSGIGDVDWTQNITSFPNPVRDILNIAMTKKLERIVITDLLGQVVKDINVHTDKVQISTDDWKPGIYIVRFFDKRDSVHNTKVIKQ